MRTPVEGPSPRVCDLLEEHRRITLTLIRKYFRELEILGIVDLTEGDDNLGTPPVMTLTTEYKWLKP